MSALRLERSTGGAATALAAVSAAGPGCWVEPPSPSEEPGPASGHSLSLSPGPSSSWQVLLLTNQSHGCSPPPSPLPHFNPFHSHGC